MPLTLAAALAASLALSACQKANDDAFGDKVRAYLLEHPEVIEQAIVKLRQNQMLEQAKTSAPTLEKHRQQLERDGRDVVLNPNGAFTLVEFFDYRCGYCKVVAPDVLKLAQENPDLRIVLKEFPIFGEVSDSAARLALTPQAKTKAVELHKAWMADRGLDEAALDRHLAEAGLDPKAVRKAAADTAIDEHLRDTRLLAGALGLQGTPAFIVGDYVIPGADMDAVRAALARTRAAAMKPPPGAPAT